MHKEINTKKIVELMNFNIWKRKWKSSYSMLPVSKPTHSTEQLKSTRLSEQSVLIFLTTH